MASFESYVQPATPGAQVPVMVDAPIVVDATSPKGLRPLLTFIASLECNSNVRVAAEEGKRLAPYFNMMSGYLSDVIASSTRLATPKEKKAVRDLVKPENLAGIFNVVAERTKNTLTSDVAVLPSNIIREGPAAHFFRDEQQFDAPYDYRGHTFNFGFLQVFEGGKRVARSSTTFPTFLLDEKMIDDAMPYGIQGTLKQFQSVMTLINHDILHHVTSPMVNPIVAHKFSDQRQQESFWESPLGKWGYKIDDADPRPDDGGEFYEAWSKAGHSAALLSSGSAGRNKEVRQQLTQYFDDLERIGKSMIAAGGNSGEARQRAHDVIDYFGTVMAHALSRSFPLDHPLMKHCIRSLQKADPAPELLPAECLEMMDPDKDVQPSMIAQTIREMTPGVPGMTNIIESYRRNGLDILPQNDQPLEYASLKLLQLIKVSREDIDPQVPSPLSTRMAELQRISGELTLEMFEAAAKTFDFLPESVRPKPKTLSPLLAGDFNRASASDENAMFAVSVYDAGTDEIPKNFALAPVADVISLLAQPDFTEDSLKAFVSKPFLEQVLEDEAARPDFREPLRMLTARSPQGLSLHILTAADTKGKPTPLYVIEDMQRKSCLVIGEEAVPSPLLNHLRKGGLTYVAKSQEDATAVIDGFMESAAKIPGRNVSSVSQNMLYAFSALCDIPEEFLTPEQHFRPGARPGEILPALKGMPSIYTSVVRMK